MLASHVDVPTVPATALATAAAVVSRLSLPFLAFGFFSDCVNDRRDSQAAGMTKREAI